MNEELLWGLWVWEDISWALAFFLSQSRQHLARQVLRMPYLCPEAATFGLHIYEYNSPLIYLSSIPTTRTIKTIALIQKQAKQTLTYGGSGLWPVQGADDDKAETLVLFAVNDHIAGLQAVGGEAFGGRGAAVGVSVGVGCVVAARRAVVGRHGAWTPPILWAGLPWNTHRTQAPGYLARVLMKECLLCTGHYSRHWHCYQAG